MKMITFDSSTDGTLTWVTDGKNVASIERWGNEANARQSLETLQNCENCIDCENCMDCRFCYCCRNCTQCDSCDFSYHCNGCIDSVDLVSCYHCQDCKNCARTKNQIGANDNIDNGKEYICFPLET